MQNKIYLLVATDFACDGGAVKVDYHLFQNYATLEHYLKPILAKYKKPNLEIFEKNGKFDYAEVSVQGYPLSPRKSWFLYHLPVISL